MKQTADDKSLIVHMLAHDRRALSLFYHKYTPQIRRYITGKVSSVDDAEEILQDTLFAFLEAIRDFEGHASVKTFLFSICNHKIIDFYRRKKITHMVFSRTPNLEAFVSPMVNPEEELDTTFLREKIHKVLSYLLPSYRTLLILKYMDNLSVAQIATKFTVSVKSVESQLFRARKAFVQRFLSI